MVDIADVVSARARERRATAVAGRIVAVTLGAALVVAVASAAFSRPRGLVLALVIALVGCAVAVRRRRPSVIVWEHAVAAAADRVHLAAAHAGLPVLDRHEVRRALRLDDNGPAPWFDPKLGPREWPFWDLTPTAPPAATVVAEKSVTDQRLVLTVRRRIDDR